MDIECCITKETLDKEYSELRKYWDGKAIEKENLIKRLKKNLLINMIVFGISVLVVFLATVVILKPAIAKHSLYKADKTAIIERARSEPDKYFDKETYEYLLEVFPMGKVDIQGYDIAEDERLIKTTWYNKKRTKVVDTDYQLID